LPDAINWHERDESRRVKRKERRKNGTQEEQAAIVAATIFGNSGLQVSNSLKGF
jgi:hypothetical protein